MLRYTAYVDSSWAMVSLHCTPYVCNFWFNGRSFYIHYNDLDVNSHLLGTFHNQTITGMTDFGVAKGKVILKLLPRLCFNLLFRLACCYRR